MNVLDRFSARALEVFAATGIPRQPITVKAAAADAPAEILLYDEIGYFGVTAQDFISAMASAGAGPIKVRINSPGGEVFDGMSIYNAMKAHPGGVTCVVDGVAASAASFIAMAGSSVEMAPNTMMMIHRARGVFMGDTNALTAKAAILAKVDGQIAGIYAAKTGADAADILASMDVDNWMTAAEAKAAGYCDIVTPDSAKAKASTPVVVAQVEAPTAPAIAINDAPEAADEATMKKFDALLRIAMAD